ncbi:MAG: hypothetical protein QOF08_784, partial [Gaiellales bacterium]|nr:hypothetical protein [Gaiellales bacterium]
MSDSPMFERDLARLIGACEAGLDLAGVLSAAGGAVRDALSASSAAAYTVSGDGAELALVWGEGPETLTAPGLEPVLVDGRAMLPLVSARRSLGCIVADGVGDQAGLTRARIAAGIAAQA